MTINKKIQSQNCYIYKENDLIRYAQRMEMTSLDEISFMKHAETCSNCLQGFLRAKTAYLKQKEKAENELLFNKTLSLMDRLDRSVFTIVIQPVKDVVELIRSTGEQIAMTPAMVGLRSSVNASTTDSVYPLCLVKEFEESRLSVEVTISPAEPDMLDIVISLLDLQHEKFVPEVSVSCCGGSLRYDVTTDENGQVFLKVPAAGFYEIIFNKDDHLLGTITLTGLEKI